MLTDLKLRDFRCFASADFRFEPGATIFVGPNARGKTSLLEAACALLRLQSPRAATLAPAIRHGARGFVLDGHCRGYHLQFYFGKQRRKLALDSVEQKRSTEYLSIARVVWFGNQDLAIVNGPAEQRRRFLDFVATQLDATYRRQLRAYERALRSRNALLKNPRPQWREISAFDVPLIEASTYLTEARARLITALQPAANDSQQAISGDAETLELRYSPSGGGDLASALKEAREEDLRLRQTTAGPHRDDLLLALNGIGSEFASEGQQRTITLALKLAQAKLLAEDAAMPPVLLIDDVFGELDVRRRNALLRHLPVDSQKLITTTNLDWMERGMSAHIVELTPPNPA